MQTIYLLIGKHYELIHFFKRIYSSLAQLVEHAAVNRRVVGSSPTGGAKSVKLELFLYRTCVWVCTHIKGHRVNYSMSYFGDS